MAAPQLGKGRAYVEIHILSVSQVRVPTRAKRYALIEDCLKKQIVPRVTCPRNIRTGQN